MTQLNFQGFECSHVHELCFHTLWNERGLNGDVHNGIATVTIVRELRAGSKRNVYPDPTQR